MKTAVAEIEQIISYSIWVQCPYCQEGIWIGEEFYNPDNGTEEEETCQECQKTYILKMNAY